MEPVDYKLNLRVVEALTSSLSDEMLPSNWPLPATVCEQSSKTVQIEMLMFCLLLKRKNLLNIAVMKELVRV